MRGREEEGREGKGKGKKRKKGGKKGREKGRRGKEGKGEGCVMALGGEGWTPLLLSYRCLLIPKIKFVSSYT